jgi:hypothetical protein
MLKARRKDTAPALPARAFEPPARDRYERKAVCTHNLKETVKEQRIEEPLLIYERIEKPN